MSLEDQLSTSLKNLGDSQQIRTLTDVDGLNQMITTRKRRRAAIAGVALSAAVMTGAVFGARAINPDVDSVTIADAPETIERDVPEPTPDNSETGSSDARTADDTSASAGASAPEAAPSGPATDQATDAAAVAPTGDALLREVIGVDGEFVATGAAGGRPLIQRSSDGELWERVATSGLPDTGSVVGLAEFPEGYVIVVDGNQQLEVAVSKDLVAWTPSALPGLAMASEDVPMHIAVTGILDGPPGLLIVGTISPLSIPTTGSDLPTPQPLTLLSTDGGRSFEVGSPPSDILVLNAQIAGGAFVLDGIPAFAVTGPGIDPTGEGAAPVRFRSVDGVTWEQVQPSSTQAEPLADEVTLEDGSIVRMAGRHSQSVCCSVERSVDGGVSWEIIATPFEFEDPETGKVPVGFMRLDSGPAGLIATGIVGEIGDAGLNMPPESLDVSIDVDGGSLRFSSSTAFLSGAPSVEVTLDDGTVVADTNVIGEQVQCCADGMFRVLLDDGGAVEAPIAALREAGADLWVTLDKDGYTLEMDSPTSPSALITLRGPDGELVDAWPLHALLSMESTTVPVPGLSVDEEGTLVFSDRTTGEVFVAFTEQEGDAAMAAASIPGLDMGEPALPDMTVYHSLDGINWEHLATLPESFPGSAAVGEDEVVLLVSSGTNPSELLSVPIPQPDGDGG